MKYYIPIVTLLFSLFFFHFLEEDSQAQPFFLFNAVETDSSITSAEPRIFFFDLRERETFIQITNLDTGSVSMHVQIFDVSNNCNENNFFDSYTPNDTHIYNIGDIKTNDGNPSGVVLPENAYGIVSVLSVEEGNTPFIGNMRILDNNGYEYRTNGAGFVSSQLIEDSSLKYTFNFNTNSGVSLSDIVGVTVGDLFGSTEVTASNITEIFRLFDIDIYNNNEVPFSCRDVIFACTDDQNPLFQSLLETGGANVASFEYGINEALPHSKGGEVLCPGNNIDEGIVILNPQEQPGSSSSSFVLFIGLNNGNSRGSFDSNRHSRVFVSSPSG